MLIIGFLLVFVASQNQAIKVSFNDQTSSFNSSHLTVSKLKAVFNITSVNYLEDLSGVRFYPYFEGNFPLSISSEVFVRQQRPKQIPIIIYSTDTRFIADTGFAGQSSNRGVGYYTLSKAHYLLFNHFKDLSIVNIKKKIAKVYLKMIGSYGESTLPSQLFVYRCDSDWYDLRDWNQQPLFNDEPYSSTIVLNALEVPYFWDVTDIVVDWVSGAFPNYGILISHNKTAGIPTKKFFFATHPIKRPCLLIYYSN